MTDTPSRWDDMIPPWRALPHFGPDQLPAKQGLEEAYYDQIWRPFWLPLSPEDRTAYLDHWDATDEWRDALAYFFEPEAGFDAEADNRESEEHLRQWREAKEAQRGFWARLFGR